MAKRWIANRHSKVASTVIFKSGHSSIRTSMAEAIWRSNEDVWDCLTRILWLREPLERMYSAYRFFKAQHEAGASVGLEVPTDDYKKFVDYVLKNSNPHWDSQIKMVTHKGKFIPTVVQKFEDINELWPTYYREPLSHINPSPKEYKVTKTYRLAELKKKFHTDIEAWANLGEKDE